MVSVQIDTIQTAVPSLEFSWKGQGSDPVSLIRSNMCVLLSINSCQIDALS